MKKTVKWMSLLLVLTMLFAVLAGCGSKNSSGSADTETVAESESAAAEPAAPAADYGAGEAQIVEAVGDEQYQRKTAEGTLTIGVNTAIDTFNPIESQSPALLMVYDTLIAINPETHELEPCLAESWEWTDDSLTCTFHLREDATFSDGTPVTAQDIYYDLYTIAHSASMASSYFQSIDFDNSSCPDDHTFIMEMLNVYAQMEYTLATSAYIYPQHFGEIATADDWWSNPVCSGAYTVVENVDGAYTKLAARPDYWRGESEAKDVTVKYFADSTAEFIAYQSGELDVAMNILESDAERILNGEEKNTNLVIASAYDFKMVALCEYVEAFQNENVRKAIAHAIDREALVESTYGVLGTVMDSNLNDSCSFYAPMGVYEYDPDLARQMLADEGYSDGDISLRMIVFNTTTDMLMAEAVQAYLEAVGIHVTVEGYIMPTAIPMFRNGECDITLTGTGGGAYDAAQVFDKIDENGTDKSTIIHDDELQELIHAGSCEMDPDVRADIYEQAQQIMYDKCYTVPIVNINSAYCFRDYIASFPCMTGEKANAWYCDFAD